MPAGQAFPVRIVSPVAVPVRFSGQRPGASKDMGGVDLLTIRDGRIVEVHLFSEDGRAESRRQREGVPLAAGPRSDSKI